MEAFSDPFIIVIMILLISLLLNIWILIKISRIEKPTEQSVPVSELIQRAKNVRVFDKLYAKKEAFVDPFTAAWEGKPSKRRRRTV